MDMNMHICKAKRLDSYEWIEGYYVQCDGQINPGCAFIIQEVTGIMRIFGCASIDGFVEVDPNTVCRNTGMTEFVMTDRSVCAPLFEGDIVEVWSRRRPVGENITLYRDNTTSQHDVEVKARAVVYFKNGEWQLDYDNAYNDAICELKGNEQVERTVVANRSLYGFGVHYNNKEWFIEHNRHCKCYDIVKIGNIYDNPELLEASYE